ncbi:MAG: hypothetical protein E5X61_13985 [Mesorhizobium sp.]|nr:MAG: hypothetical protein E5X61_13985 [Mesorhizobium sp.]
MHRTAILADELDARFSQSLTFRPSGKRRDPSRPPLSCRTSPPLGGRSDCASGFANFQRCGKEDRRR